MLARAVKLHRTGPAQRLKRPVVVEALAAVAIGRSRGGINERRASRRAPVQEPEREAEIGGENGISVGGGGGGAGAGMNDRFELAAVEPADHVAGRHTAAELA